MPGVFDPPLRPTPYDGLSTDTWLDQLETETEIAKLFDSTSPSFEPVLRNQAHLAWLARPLYLGFPEKAEGYDASQPWLIYWSLQGLLQLGGVLDDARAAKCVQTLLRFQHPSGGFAGGPMQLPHLLPTYAAVCALAIVGGPGPAGGWDQIDRVGLYNFFLSLKQADSSFIVCEDGEVDMRGFYCLLTVATMLDILTPELVDGLAGYIAKCQTYEGGFSSAGFDYGGFGHVSLGEAHGGYTYCGLASLFLLRPLYPTALSRIDVPRLIRWTASMQGSGIEGGGFRGRTNKLVDACYSWWVGGMDPMLRELVREDGGDSEWEDWDDAILNKEAVQRYILTVAQVPAGGLRDKPGKNPDAYHTNSALSGLATAQHRVAPSPEVHHKMVETWKDDHTATEDGRTKDQLDRRRDVYLASCDWTEDEEADSYLGGEKNRVNAVHPLYGLTITSLRRIMGHFYGQDPVKSSVD